MPSMEGLGVTVSPSGKDEREQEANACAKRGQLSDKGKVVLPTCRRGDTINHVGYAAGPVTRTFVPFASWEKEYCCRKAANYSPGDD